MTINIDTALFGESMGKALEIYHMSSNLESIQRVEYNERRPSFAPLVSEAGYTEFHPVVVASVVEPFKEMFAPVIREWHSNYYLSENDEEAREGHDLYRLAGLFNEHLTNEDIVNGTIPNYVKDFIVKRKLKGFTSPKLSRALAKLCKESSSFWAWYTNKCPKKITKGENKDYKVVVSTLPHHIAGMSYYSCFNSGGKRWNGWEGTSCQDPKRNGGGSAMRQLPASVKDETLALAYLTKTENDDIMNPVMEARALIRVVELTNGNFFYVVLRQFGYTESIAIMLDGLQSQYPNVFTNNIIRNKYGNAEGKCIRIKMKVKDIRYHERYECDYCEGRGHDHDDETCDHCDGEGTERTGNTFLPYNDDTDIWTIERDTGKKITYRIPKQLLIDKGLYGAQEETHEVA
jgi:ribosomal protein L37AE/L43A